MILLWRKADVTVSTDEEVECENCNGRKCMGCVLREWDHKCAEDCPSCCTWEGRIAVAVYVNMPPPVDSYALEAIRERAVEVLGREFPDADEIVVLKPIAVDGWS